MNTVHDRSVLLSLLVAGVSAVAPHVPEMPPWIVAVFAAGAVWRYLIDTQRWHRPGRFVRVALMVLVIVGIFRQYGTLLGRDPGIALLITLLGLKFLELKTQRDAVVTLFVYYLVILGSFLYSQSLWLGCWALVAVTASTMALMHLMQPTGLTLFSRLRLSAVMLAKAVPLMIVVYLLFPRISGTLWGLPADAYSGLTGMSDIMQPGSIRSLSESSEIAFRATFEGAPPPLRELYWRGLVLTDTNGRGWSRAAASPAESISFTPLNDPVTYQVTLEPSNKPWMPALELPGMRPKGARYQPDFTLEHRDAIRERLNYTLTSYTRYRTGELAVAERAKTLRLPGNVSPRTRDLAEQWRRENSNPASVARAALNYFNRENFVYTLNPPLLGDNPVDEFLFTTRRGFCEHYAAAFVTLMRAAGIPSRVVIGYLGGEVNTAGNYLIVRQSDAHAWAEIWSPERGWMRVDPTGAIAPERIELGFDAVRRLELQGVALGRLPTDAVLRALQLGWLEYVALHTRWYWDISHLAWYRWVADYGKERQEKFLMSLGIEKISWGRLFSLLLACVLLITLGYALMLWRTKKSSDFALALYRRFCRKLARAELVRAPHEGPLDFARRCVNRRPDLSQQVRIITDNYLRARYGATVQSDTLRALKREIRRFQA